VLDLVDGLRDGGRSVSCRTVSSYGGRPAADRPAATR
jgi:hypothetical protein